MAYFSEQDIRGLAIGFLRRHYRLRDRYASSGTRVYSKPHYYEGVKIDARFAYQKPDRTFFTATVEATPVDRADEILYRVNWWRICWDALTGTLLLMAVAIWVSSFFHSQVLDPGADGFFAGTQVQRFNIFRTFGRSEAWGFVSLVFVVLLLSFGLLISRLHRYRYIYAISQFKRFYADDQWIAFDEQIFRSKKDRRYRELRDQATRYGFGLMRVLPGGEIVADIHPSQIDQFAGQRSRLPQWMAAIEKPTRVLQALPAARKVKQLPAPPPVEEEFADPLSPSPYLPVSALSTELVPMPPPRPGRPKWWQQPGRSFTHFRFLVRKYYRDFTPGELHRWPGYYELPWWLPVLAMGSLLLLSAGLWQQSSWSPIADVGDKAAAPRLRLETASTPEQGEQTAEVEPGEFQPTPGRNADAGTLGSTLDLVESPVSSLGDSDVHRYRIAEDGEVSIDYNCQPLATLGRTVYLLRENYYPGFSSALRRAESIHRTYGIPTTVALNNCINLNRPGYLVYLFDPTDDEGLVNFWIRQSLNGAELELEVMRVE